MTANLLTLIGIALAGSACTADLKVHTRGTGTATAAQVSKPSRGLEPLNLVVSDTSDSTITLEWTSAGASGGAYRAAYLAGPTAPADCESGTVGDRPVRDTKHVVRGLSPDTTYSFRVCALDDSVSPPVLSAGVTITASTATQALPPDVSELRALVESATQVTLTWKSGGGTTSGFRLSYERGTTAPPCASDEHETEEPAYGVSGLEPGVTYSFRVCAINSNATPGVSAGVVVMATTSMTPAPADPRDLQAIAVSSSEVTLRWVADVQDGAFRISYQPGDSAPPSCQVGTLVPEPIVGLTHTLKDLIHQTLYAFRVCALAADGVTVSRGVTITVTTPAQPAPPDPIDLKATADAEGQVVLSWTSGAGSTAGFHLTYALGATPPADCAAGTPVTDTVVGSSHTIAGLAREGLYSFRLCAVNANAIPDVSSGITASFVTPGWPLPPDALALSADAASENALVLSWESGGGSTSAYRLAMVAGGTPPADCAAGSAVAGNAVGKTVHIVDGLAPATTYSFRLCALNANATPDVSAGLTLSVATSEPPQPAEVRCTALLLANAAADGLIPVADSATVSPLVLDPIGSNFTTAAYAVTLPDTSCDSVAAWAATKPTAADLTADASYKVCVKLSNAENTAAYCASDVILRDTVPPAFTSVAAAGVIADAYLSAGERASAATLVNSAVGAGFDAAKYQLVPVPTDCTTLTAWGAVPTSASSSFGADGAYKVCVMLTDTAGNPPAYGESAAFALDTEPPVFTSLLGIHEAADGYITASETASANLLLALSASGYATARYAAIASETPPQTCDASLSYTVSSPVTIASLPSVDDTYAVCVELADAAGNITYGKSAPVVRSTQGPTVSLTGAPLGFSAATTLSIAASGANVASYSYAVGSGNLDCATAAYSAPIASTAAIVDDISALPDGSITVCARGLDTLGNQQDATSATSVTWTKDTVAPTVTLAPLPAHVNDATKAAVALSGTCSENGQVVTIGGSVTASLLCASNAWAQTIDFSAVADGTLTLTVAHADAAGNLATPAVGSSTKDVAIPTVTLSAPAFISSASQAAVALSGGCSENGRSVLIGGAASASATCNAGSWSVAVDYSAIADGSIAFTLSHTDAAGNTKAVTGTPAQKDTVAPVASLSGAPAGTNAAISLAVTVAGADVTHYRFKVGGAGVDCAQAAGYGAETPVSSVIGASIAGVLDGAVTLCVVGRDQAGNWQAFGDATTASWTKDTDLAVVGIDALPYINGANKAAVVITGTCSEIGRSVIIGGALSSSATCIANVWTATLDYSSLADGNVALTADHADATSNSAIQASAAFIKDTVAPTVSIQPMTFIDAANVAAAALSGTCSEPGRAVSVGGAVSISVTCAADSTWSAVADFSASPDGPVSITVGHTDAAGNSAAPGSTTPTKDTLAPAAVLAGQPTGTSNAIALSVVVSGAGITAYRHKVVSDAADCINAAGYAAEAPVATLITNDISALAQGNTALCVIGRDAAGNWQSLASATIATWTKDTLAPTVSLGSLPYINAANKSAVVIAGGCSENGRNVVIGGAVAATAACAGGAWTKTLDYSAVVDGSVAVTIDHADAAGNNATQVTASFTKDTVSPAVAVNTLPVINATNKAAVPVSGTCSENGRAVSIGGAVSASLTCASGSWSASLDYSAAADGSVIITADHTDAAGNAATQASGSLTKDTAPPTVALGTLPYINGGNKTAVPVSGTCSENGRTVSIGGAISGNATCTGGAFSLNLDYSAVTDGSVAVTADLSDTAGNSAPQAVGSLTKDTIPPTVTLGALPVINAANKSAVAVGGSCSEDGGTINIGGAVSSSATCSGGAWSKTVNYGGASDGSVGITVDATDAAGNNAAQASGSFTKDTVQPTVSFNALPYINNANKASVPVSGSCSENGRTITIGGGVATTATCSAGAFSLSIDYSGLADGAVAITADLSDAAGNAATQASGSMTKDIVAPTVGLSSIYINSTNYTAAPLSGTCSENTLAVTIGGSRTGSTTCSSNLWSTTVDYSGVADGSVSVTADHQDAAGNGATQASATLTKDTVAPTATITNAPTGASRASVLDVTIGGVDVNDYRYRLFNGTGTCVGGTYSSWTTASTHIADNFSSLNDDTVKLCVQGRDVAGNAQDEASATVATWTKDTTPPTAPASFTATQGHRKLTLSWADGGGGTSGYVVARRTGAAVDWTPSGGDTYSVNDTVGSSTVVYVGTSTTYSDTGLTNGTTYYYSIFAYDSLKNYSSASTQSKAPQAPISETDLVLWLDASEISTLYQSSDCSTSPVTADSQTVGCWKGLSGSNINVSQATSGNRPTYLTSGLGTSKAGLSFASKWLTGTLTGLTGNQNHTMIVVFKYSSLSSTNNVVLKIGTDGTNTKTSLESTSANFKDSFYSSAVLYTTLTNNSAYFATKTYNGSAGPHNRVSYLNGKVGPMAGTSGTLSTLSLPSNPTVEVGGAASADYFSGVISEVIVYSRAVGYAELTSINTYLAAKWGITDPGSCHGKSVGGYCWYQSMKNYSCNDVCAGISAYDSGTCSYGAANAANCQGIFDAIGAPGSGAPVSTTSYSGGGCLFYDAGKKDKDNSRKYNLTCNATYKHADIFRLCACTLP